MFRDDLLSLINKHRSDAVITCEENCLCWAVEEVLYSYDLEQQSGTTTLAVDVALCATTGLPVNQCVCDACDIPF